MTDTELKQIRDDEAVRQRVRTELSESSGYHNKVDIANGVKIVDFDIPFWQMVLLLIKVSIAAIPAAIILAVVYFLFFSVIAGIFATLFTRQ